MTAAAAQQAAMAAALQGHDHLRRSTEMPLFYGRKDKDIISARLFINRIETLSSDIVPSSGGTPCSMLTSTSPTIKLSRPTSWQATNPATQQRRLAPTSKNWCNIRARLFMITTSKYTTPLPRCVKQSPPTSAPPGLSLQPQLPSPRRTSL